jgi:hypothetical protein
VGAPGEDVQDQLGPVDDLQVPELGDGAHLRARKLALKDDQVGALLHGGDHEVLELAAADHVAGVQIASALGDHLDHLDPGRIGQLPQLGHRLLEILQAAGGDAYQDALARRSRDLAGVAVGGGGFLFEARQEGGEVEVEFVDRDRLFQVPGVAPGLFRFQPGQMEVARKA